MSQQKTITVSVFNPNTDADTVRYLREIILLSKIGKVDFCQKQQQSKELA